MKKIIDLVKVFLKLNLNFKISAKKKSSRILLLVGLGIYLLFIYISMWRQFINPLKEIGQEHMSIYLLLNISSALIFMTSIAYIINILYFSNDMEHIIPFPFKPREIFASKLIVIYLYELMIAGMLCLPGFITYGVELNQGILYYFLALIVFIFIPVIPIILLAIIDIILAHFLKINKYQNYFKIASTIIILVVVFGFQMNMNSNMSANGEYDANYIFEMCNNIKSIMPYNLQVVSRAFENVGSFSSIVSLIWFIVMNIALVLITVFAFDKIYMNTIYLGTGVISKHNKKEKIKLRRNNSFYSIVEVELKKLFRNVTFFIQCVLPTTFMPILILATTLTAQGQNLDFDIASNPVVKMLFAFLIVQFFMMMNQISATAISRDGEKEAGYFKSLPIKKSKLLEAKAMPSIYVGLFSLIISIGFCFFIFNLNVLEFVFLIISGILLNYIQSYLFIIIDIKKPKLQWESELAVIKQNMNVLKAIGIWFAVLMATSLYGNIFIILNIKSFGYIFILTLFIVYLSLKYYLAKNADRFYEKVF